MLSLQTPFDAEASAGQDANNAGVRGGGLGVSLGAFPPGRRRLCPTHVPQCWGVSLGNAARGWALGSLGARGGGGSASLVQRCHQPLCQGTAEHPAAPRGARQGQRFKLFSVLQPLFRGRGSDPPLPRGFSPLRPPALGWFVPLAQAAPVHPPWPVPKRTGMAVAPAGVQGAPLSCLSKEV